MIVYSEVYFYSNLPSLRPTYTPNQSARMASGERITVTYSRPNRSLNAESIKLDLYAFVPPLHPTDPGPTFSKQNRLPFILFLHGGHFLTGSKRDVPPWLASLARDNGLPLVCADYRLAPHAGPTHAFEDVQTLWTFIREELNWIIACSGNGAEVESGNEMLEGDFGELQRRGGLDIERGILVGMGSGGYLAAMGGALLSPPPLAMVLGYPLLEISKVLTDSPGYFVPASTPGHLRPTLNPDHVGRVEMAKTSVPDMPMALDKSPYAADMRTRFGMDAREPWKGKEESIQRQELAEFLLKDDRLSALLRKASPNLVLPSDILLQSDQIKPTESRNRPYPPTLIYHGQNDERISPDTSKRFLDMIRNAEPVAATMDALASGGFYSSSSSSFHETEKGKNQSQITTSDSNNKNDEFRTTEVALRCVESNPNHTSRYLYLEMEGTNSGHAFDALLPREMRQPPFSKISPKSIGDRYMASLIHAERFIQHWLLEGSAERAAAQKARRKEAEERSDGISDDSNATKSEGKGIEGARIKLPIRGPRL